MPRGRPLGGARGCTVLLLAMAAVAVDAGDGASPPARRKVYRSRDGTTFVFDPVAKAWCPSAAEEEAAPPPSGPQLALPWSQFGVAFDGDFRVGGAPLLLGPRRPLRSNGEQQHGDTGRSVWDGAVALSKVLEHNRQLVEGRRVLEVGAGRGVSGISAARLGARRSVITDLAYCLDLIKEAVALNGLAPGGPGDGVEVAELNWATPEAFLDQRPGEHFDLVIAADVVWLLELIAPLAAALRAICERNPAAEVVLVHQTRATNVDEAFLEAMAQEAFELAWELQGGAPPGEAATSAARGRPDHLTWHPDYVPDGRVRLLCFRWRAPGGGEAVDGGERLAA